MLVEKYRKVIIVGDIHGCLDELKSLMEKTNYDSSKDLLISAGDIVDRGPKSADCVKYLISINAIGVLGNHDAKLMRYNKHLLRKKENKSYRFPMHIDPERENIIESLSPEELDWINSLPAYIFLDEYNTAVVHAGVLPNMPLEKQPLEILTMVRYVDPQTLKMKSLNKDYSRPEGSVYWTSVYNDSYNVVYGHCVHDLKEPNVVSNSKGAFCFGIDTGACFGGRMTAVVFSNLNKDPEIVQVDSFKKYSEFKKIDSF